MSQKIEQRMMKKVMALATTALLFLTLAGSTPARADFSSWVKGCLIMGGMGAGGVVIGASVSGADLKDNTAIATAAALSCIVGGYLSSDIQKKAELDVKGELTLENTRLKNKVYGTLHDLCVLKRECGPDGLTPRSEYMEKLRGGESDGNAFRLKSGN